jgi:putative addiction module component (TIGR02574 family)
MANLIDELSQRARALPPEDRARLAEELLASLAPHDADVEAAWDIELRRRIDEIDRGEAPLVPAEEAFAAVRRALRR